jgi:DNA repair photolyase
MVVPPQRFSIACKSLLTRSGIPSVDYAANPYFGCEHGCLYCYATFMLKFRPAPGPWGTFVGVKENAADVLGREARRGAHGRVLFSSVCDAYQPVEAARGLTRACLSALVGAPGLEVGILTKSDLVVRDLDVLSRLRAPSVGFSVTTLDEGVARIVEPGAASPRSRLEAMRELSRAGVGVWGFVAPVLPGLSDGEDALRALLGAMRDAGAGHALVDTMNPYPQVVRRLRPVIAARFPEHLAAFDACRTQPLAHAAALAGRVERAGRAARLRTEICFRAVREASPEAGANRRGPDG